MSHKVCHDVGSWVNQNVSQQLQQCVEQDCNWWCLCCNKWFCFLVWVIVTIVTWVVQTVCEIIADVVDVVVNVLNGLADIIGGILTGDGTKILAGLGELFGSGVLLILELIPIATLGTLVGAFRDGGSDWLLRIMYTMNSAEGKNAASWWSLFQYWTSGAEAGFILDESKRVWDYIIENFTAYCLSQRQF